MPLSHKNRKMHAVALMRAVNIMFLPKPESVVLRNKSWSHFSEADLWFDEKCVESVWVKRATLHFFSLSNSHASFYSRCGLKKKKKERGRRREQHRSWDTVFKTFACLLSTTYNYETTMIHLQCTSMQRLARCCISTWLDIIVLFYNWSVFTTCKWWWYSL